MNDNRKFIGMINDNLNEIGKTIDYLYVTSNSFNKNRLLNNLRKNVSNLSTLVQGIQSNESKDGGTQNGAAQNGTTQNGTTQNGTTQNGTTQNGTTQNGTTQNGTNQNAETRIFTTEELSEYNGMNGMPAYIAVNGVVYDVTNNAAWAGATHFGLPAGQDLTGEYSPCHYGNEVLNKLKIVGMMQE